MRKVLLVRFGEVYLKGLNRPYFLKRLTDNIRHAVQPIGGHVWLSDSRIYVSNAEDLEECARRVCRVFGVHSVSYAYELDKNWEEIVSACVEAMKPLSGTFKVLARRSDKTFPMDSMTMAGELGYEVLKSNPNLSVDVHHPAHKLNVEIRDFAYVSVGEIPAVGGMPLGTGGRAALLLSGGIDSPVAGYHLMRRGVVVEAIHFQSPPYTSERAKEKVLALAKILGEYGGGMRVHLVPFTKIQMEIHEKCPDGLGTLLTRRFMMRIAQRLGGDLCGRGLVPGGVGHGADAPVHDAHRRKNRPQKPRAGVGHGRKPGAGCQPDDGSHWLHGRRGAYARVPPPDRVGQAGNHRAGRPGRHQGRV